jgi:hypothetical protein
MPGVDGAKPCGKNAYPIAQCTIAHRLSPAEPDNLAQEQFWNKQVGPVSRSVDNTPAPVIELENRKCATY